MDIRLLSVFLTFIYSMVGKFSCIHCGHSLGMYLAFLFRKSNCDWNRKMPRLVNGLLVLFLAGWGVMSHASLLNDDSIMYSVDLATSSGNSISTSGTFSPGADAYCFSFLGPCPPGTLFDTDPLENSNSDFNLSLLFNAEAESISMLIVDTVVGVPEYITGTLTFSDIGWGEMDGQIVGGEVCGIGFAGCGPDFGFEAEFSADAVTIEIDSFLSIFSSSSGTLTGIGQVTVDFEVEHVPAPVTTPLIAIALVALGWSRRKKSVL